MGKDQNLKYHPACVPPLCELHTARNPEVVISRIRESFRSPLILAQKVGKETPNDERVQTVPFFSFSQFSRPQPTSNPSAVITGITNRAQGAKALRAENFPLSSV